ncbi:unnamed protein product [Closterium sp. Naga37s-1]|nr:unnamed protein product [Closterium sp. Naga37s-1]
MAAACASHSPAPVLIPPSISPPILPLIPPLPDDVSIACLARLNLWDLAVARCVSRGWAAAIASDAFAQQRRRQQALGAQRVRRVVTRHGADCASCAQRADCAECASSSTCCPHRDARDCIEGRSECDVNGVNGYVCLCAASRRHPGRLDWFAFDLSAPSRAADALPPASAASAASAADCGGNKGTRWTFSGSACNESRRNAEGAGSSCSSGGSRFRLSACGRSGCGGLCGSNGYGRWRRLPPIPPSNPHGSQRCRHFSVAAIPGWGLAIAGGVVLGTGEAVRHVSLFDWLAGRWVQVQHEGFSARLDPVVVWAGGRLFVGGGGEIGGKGKMGGRGNVWGAGMGGVQGGGEVEGERMRVNVTTALHPSISPRSCDIIRAGNRVYARYRHRLTCFSDHPTSPSAAPATAAATASASGGGCVLQLDLKQVVVAGGRLFALVLLVDRGRHEMREMGVHGKLAGVVGPGIELPGEAYVAHAVGLCL